MSSHKAMQFSSETVSGSLRAMSALVLGVVLGTWMWLASPVVTGRAEPWDDRGWYYVTALAVCGLAGGLAARRWWWPAVVGTVVGVYLGQAAVMFPLAQDGGERAPWWAGALVLAAYTGIALAGALVGVAARWGAKWIHRGGRGERGGGVQA